MEQCFLEIYKGSLSLDCLKLILAKVFGTIILIMSFTLKLPQIKDMIRLKSSKGISATSSYFDFLSVVFSLVYCYKTKTPFTIWAEYVSIIIQNFLIIALAWKYSPVKIGFQEKAFRFLFIIISINFIYIGMFTDLFPKWMYDIMAASNIPIVSVSRAGQIYELIKYKKAGAVSFDSFLMRFLKNSLKFVCLLIETNDSMLLFNQLYNALMNLIVMGLIVYYRRNEKLIKDKKSS